MRTRELQLEAVQSGDRPLRLRCDTRSVSTFLGIAVVDDSALKKLISTREAFGTQKTHVRCNAIVPKNDGVRRPVHTCLEVPAARHMIVQEVEDVLCERCQRYEDKSFVRQD